MTKAPDRFLKLSGAFCDKIMPIYSHKVNKFAKRVFARSGEMLGKGLSILVDLINPEKIVIGSIFTRSADLLWPFAEEEIAREALSASAACCQVVPAALGEQIGDYAALAVALS